MSFVEDMRKAGLRTNLKREPVWSGPDGAGSQGGITFSLLSRFLVCRARFGALTLQGLQPPPSFNHRIEYGNLWHVCEEALAAKTDWKAALSIAEDRLKNKYRFSQEEVYKWVRICAMQFPEYVNYWKKHPDVVKRKPVLQEVSFDVRYELPSKRCVRLRGKWDSVDIIDNQVWLQENKTKGDINEGQIKKQLKYDMQTMMYLVALNTYRFPDGIGKGLPDKLSTCGMPIGGIRYNIVQRPLSGEKGTIRQKQNEDEDDYYERLGIYFFEEPERYFHRWKIPISQDDTNNFKRKSLDPILENLWDWWDEVTDAKTNVPKGYKTPMQWITPFGIYNVLLEGGSTDQDDYLLTGSTVGLTRTDNLFPELS